MTDRRVIVTGSRDWTDTAAVWAALERLLNAVPLGYTMTVIEGECPSGADNDAFHWAILPDTSRGTTRATVRRERYPADWSRTCDQDCYHRPRTRNGRPYCPMAGHLRNQFMVDLGADLVIAFPLGKSLGTRDCMRRARGAGISVRNLGERVTESG
ncbi:SLOG family protein [Nocardia gipuzkoensis]